MLTLCILFFTAFRWLETAGGKMELMVWVLVTNQQCVSALYTNNSILILYGHIKTAEQRFIIQQYCDWYTGHWWMGCYIWYSEGGTGRAVSPGWVQSPPRCTKCNSAPINGQCTNLILFDMALQSPLNYQSHSKRKCLTVCHISIS